MRRVVMLLAARWPVWAGLAWLVTAQGLEAQPIRRGPPIQFSEPQNDLLITNANRLPRSDQPESRLSEELQRRASPFQQLGDPLRPGWLPRPPAGPLIQSARVRELLERQRMRDAQSGADPLNQVRGLDGERRLHQSPLGADAPDTGSEETMDPKTWTRFAEELGSEWANPEAEVPEEGDARTRDGSASGRKSPEAAATEARVEQLEKALREGGDGGGLLNLSPGLERSFWDGPMTSAESDLARSRARSREDRLERFRAGLEAIAAAPERALDPARLDVGGQTTRTAGRSLALPTSPLWMETTSGTGAGLAQPWPSSPGRTAGAASPGPGLGALGNQPGADLGTSAAGSPLGGTLAPPVTRPPATPTRGPKMPSPFTEIPKRPGI